MSGFDYDLFVIGAGSGGVRAARVAAGYGARVAVAEDYRVGGTCVLRGCVPKKLLVHGAHVSDEIEEAAGFGWTIGGARHDWARLIANKNAELDRLNGVYIDLLNNAGVEIIDGRGVVDGANTVRVADRRVSAEHILIAVGGWPVKPDHPGVENAITSNEALELPALPERVVVAGGGYVAVEFAGIFSGYGARVTQVYRGEQILRGFDRDVRDFVAAEMTKKGVDIRTGVTGQRLEKTKNGFVFHLSDGSSVETDCVLCATGRRPNTAALGLESVGVELRENGAVAVDAYGRASAPGVHAVGDVTDRVNLTPVALAEGHAFADTVFGGRPRAVDHNNIASAVFSRPPVAVVGLSEEDARAAGRRLDIYRSEFRPLKHTLSGSSERAMMKLVVDQETDRVLGAHMVGADAAEIIQGVAIAIKMGARKADFDATIGIHPTAAEEFVTMRTPVRRDADRAAE